MAFTIFGPVAHPRRRPMSRLWGGPGLPSEKQPSPPAPPPPPPPPPPQVEDGQIDADEIERLSVLDANIGTITAGLLAQAPDGRPGAPSPEPLVTEVLADVARAAGLPVEDVAGGDGPLAVTARQVALVVLTWGHGMGRSEVEQALGLAPGAATKAQAIHLPELQRRAISFRVGAEAVARALLAGGPSDDRRVTVADCQMAAAQAAGLRPFDLKSHRRHAPLVRARQVGMWLAKEFTARSLPEIGRSFGGRDHTTVLHAVRKLRPVAERVRASLPADATPERWAEALLAADWKEARE